MTDESLSSDDDRQRYKNLLKNIWKLQRLREK